MRFSHSHLVLLAALLLALSPTARASALSLDGTGDYVTFDGVGLPTGNDPFTVEAWINPTSIPAGGESGGQITFWGNQTTNQSNGFRLRGGGGVRHYFWGNDHDEDFGIDILPDATGDNGWHHLALTFDGSETRWFWNGAPLGAPRNASGVNVANGSNHRIGSRLDAEFFHGFIDDVRVWSKARSAAEIAGDFDQGLTGTEADLVAYFDFESGYTDGAGGDNDGTPVGDATIDAAANAPTQTSGPAIADFSANPPIVFEGQNSTLTWQVDDSNVAGSLLIEILDPADTVVHTASTASGDFAVNIGDTGGSAQTLTYKLRASESGGDMISREAITNLDAQPGIPAATPQSLLAGGATALNITLGGADPNAHPNPSLSFELLSSPAGTLTGTPPDLVYTADPGFLGPDSFDFRVSDGKYDSPPATISIEVGAPPVPPTNISLSTSTIGESVVDGGFVATLSSTDANDGDTHSYALVAGAGDDDNVLFSIVGDQLRSATTFAGQVGNMVSLRLRTTDGNGFTFEKAFVLEVVDVSDSIVINEIHYNPPDNTVRQEFIELFNPAASEADISGWRISGAVSYVFPADTKIPGGGFLVIGEEPPTIASTFRTAALGPYSGSLDSDGETIRLRNQNDAIVDFVDYRTGFPWPTAGDGEGASIELINPALDNSLGSSWRATLRANGAVAGPTPNDVNLNFADNAAPNIRKVAHTPQQPTAAEQCVITARVSDPEGVASVELEYQVVGAGLYIPSHLAHPVPNIPVNDELAENPAYNDPANWTTVTMVDDGTGGDALAGDDVYTVTLPAQTHRTLVRYRITVEDTLGLSERVPYADDPSLNFAYFVYDGVPAYNGHSVETMNSLPVYHLITHKNDWNACIAYDSGQISQGSPNPARFYYNWKGTLVYDGEVYDNIRYRLRGANGRYHARGKRSMRFRLNKGNYFQARDQFGKLYPRKLRTLTTGKCFGNRQNLSYSLNEAVSMYLYNKVGVPGCNTHWVHWRVIDDGREAPDQYHGDFHGIYFILETYDVRFLETHDLEKGNLYKLINSTRSADQQQRYQAALAPPGGRDHDWIENTLSGNTAPEIVRAHVNLEKWNLNHAMVEAIKHYDYWPSANKNMVYYFEPDYLPENRGYGKLWILPWDTDATWGPTYNSGHDVVYNALFAAGGGGSDGASNPELWPDYFNTVREIRDLLWQRDQIGGVLDEFASFITPLEQADRDRWQNAPSTSGNYGGLVGAGLTSLAALVQDMNNFAFVGGSWPGGGVGPGGRAAYLDSRQAANGEGALIPGTPTLRYRGDPAFPTNNIAFESGPFRDPQGDTTFGAMEYRLAEITDPGAPGYDPTERFKLEWESVWESGVLTTFEQIVTIPTAALRSGRTYRARVRHQDNTGRWGHWSPAFEFTTTLPDISEFLNGLVISEFMYHPTDPTASEFAAGFTNDDDFEWIELRNVGPVPLSLTDLRFTKGIDFDFLGADITSLDPGEFVLVVSNRAAFEMRYGAGLPISGEWDSKDKLDNGGERLKLSYGAGDPIRDFIFDDLAPWPTSPDGSGTSLTLVSPTSLPNHALAASWRGSFSDQGTPGAGEATGGFPSWLIDQGALDPLAPYGTSGMSNLLAYSLGADLAATPGDAFPFLTLIDVGGELYPALNYRRRLSATDLTYVVEVSQGLLNWNSGPALTVTVGAPANNGDGTVTITVRSLQSLVANPRQFLRLRTTVTP